MDFRINLLKEYFGEARLFMDDDGKPRVVPKYKEQKFKVEYPKTKKIKKEVLEKFSSEYRMFLSKDKHYLIPSDEVNDFLKERIDAQVISLTK